MVKRYVTTDEIVELQPNGAWKFTDITVSAFESPVLVLASDYDALAAENERLKNELSENIGRRDVAERNHVALTAEVAALRETEAMQVKWTARALLLRDEVLAESERLRKTLKSLLDEMLIKDCTLRNYDVYHVSKGEVQLARAVLRDDSDGKENV